MTTQPDPEPLEVKAFHQFMDLFVLPEIRQRQERGAALKPLELTKVQILFSADGAPPLVRLNEEVKAHARVKLKQGVEKSKDELVWPDEIEAIEAVDLPEHERNHGHFTAIKRGRGWCIFFSFIYNRRSAKQMLELGQQFWRAAKDALDHGHLRVCVDNLFSAAELAAKASIVCWNPDPKFRAKATHKGIITRYGQYAKVGNAPKAHSSLLAKLGRLRSSARYLQGRFAMTAEEAEDALRSVGDMLHAAGQSI